MCRMPRSSTDKTLKEKSSVSECSMTLSIASRQGRISRILRTDSSIINRYVSDRIWKSPAPPTKRRRWLYILGYRHPLSSEITQESHQIHGLA